MQRLFYTVGLTDLLPFAQQGNYAKFLKSLHTEQINKLQVKNQYECELLDDIR